MAVANPFLMRYTEQQRDHVGFLRTFGVEMLDILPGPEVAWNRLTVLRSAPGAGKTSILRLLTPDSVRTILDTRNPDDIILGLRQRLEHLDVVADGVIKRVGVLVNVGDDYRSLLDLGPEGNGNRKVFLRLLDARILIKTVEAVLEASGLSFPRDAGRIRFDLGSDRAGEAARHSYALISGAPTVNLQWIDGEALLGSARRAEAEVLSLIDSLLPVEWDTERGHSKLYSLPLLSEARISIDTIRAPFEIALLIDDVHDLERGQRELLYGQLLDRGNRMGRWIAERKEAVPDYELLTGHTAGRDFTLVTLEDALSGHRGGVNNKFQRILGNIANARAIAPLSAVGVTEPFVSLFPEIRSEARSDLSSIVSAARADVVALVDAHPQYRPWLEERDRADTHDPLEVAIGWRELRILVERDLSRSPVALFEIEVAPDRISQLSSGATRAAARLFLAKEQKLPYYSGTEVLADLASKNVEQYLSLSGDLFELVVSAATLGRRGTLTPAEQDRRVRSSSKRLWTEIAGRVPHGPDVLALLHVIADRGRSETYRPTAPYAPGVTGTAIDFRERLQLFGDSTPTLASHATRGTDFTRLSRALASAVASNLLEMSAEPTRTKGRNFAVFYLNRLLCPHFDLPLARGGFREQRIDGLADRLEIAVRSAPPTSVPSPDSVLSELEGWPA